MPFTLRLNQRFPVQCAVTYHAGPFSKVPLVYISSFWVRLIGLAHRWQQTIPAITQEASNET